MIGALAPIIVLSFIAWFRRALRKEPKVEYFAAFRDGQLGYVGLGWAAGAFAELIKAMARAPTLTGSMVLEMVLILLAALLNGMVAGINAVGPTPLEEDAPALSIWTKAWWFDRYAAFASSLLLAVLTLALAAWAHALAD
ncbi:hypothetical protein [Pararobbsia silviterrae]|uniref:Uncharacterized protein n=1 Tax=Pararobbsia silviterrae TaxID=1792498 RepID=A0A494XZE8_9BURK|nr:hypothetical protein [Pararobbsia silviterrae]RKP55924.1 hypothetical protein D7S86_12050 [Pararobbsia silviterrae]